LDASDNDESTGAPIASVEMEFAARAEHLSEVRRAVSDAATSLGFTRATLDDLLTAVDEAVANAIRHGSPRGERDRVAVQIKAKPHKLTVSVRDSGGGFATSGSAPTMPAPDALGGRGLPLMAALADSLEITSTPHGTTIVLHKRIA